MSAMPMYVRDYSSSVWVYKEVLRSTVVVKSSNYLNTVNESLTVFKE